MWKLVALIEAPFALIGLASTWIVIRLLWGWLMDQVEHRGSSW